MKDKQIEFGCRGAHIDVAPLQHNSRLLLLLLKKLTALKRNASFRCFQSQSIQCRSRSTLRAALSGEAQYVGDYRVSICIEL